MPGNDSRLAYQRDWLDQLPNDIATLLDVGAGAGSHSDFFHANGITVTALDTDPSNFRGDTSIEFIDGDVLTWDDGRKFDAVFASHVLEHAPDTARFLARLKHFVKDDGYLIIVVPRFEGLVCDEHWNIGWTCGQLAMTLVAIGLDCSEARFEELRMNVCGWGRKRPIPASEFIIEESAPYLPPAMTASIITSGEGNLHIPDLASTASKKAVPHLRQLVIRHDGFSFADCVTLTFEKQGRQDIVFDLPKPVDLNDIPLYIFALHEGDPATVRIAFDSSPNDAYEDVAERYLEQFAGAVSAELTVHDFDLKQGRVDFSRIRRIVVGGMARDAVVRCWVYAGDRNMLAGHEGQKLAADATRRADKARAEANNASRLFFLENRANRLEQALARLQARNDVLLKKQVVHSLEPSTIELKSLLAAALRGLYANHGAGVSAPDNSSPRPPTSEEFSDLLRSALRQPTIHRVPDTGPSQLSVRVPQRLMPFITACLHCRHFLIRQLSRLQRQFGN